MGLARIIHETGDAQVLMGRLYSYIGRYRDKHIDPKFCMTLDAVEYSFRL